jgi:NCAIR mutase (PurE)-related protein
MTQPQQLRDLLLRVAQHQTSIEDAAAALWQSTTTQSTVESLGFATIDHDRSARCGFPEVIFCEGKTPAQVAAIAARLAEHSEQVLGTRANREQFTAVAAAVPGIQFHEAARVIHLDRNPQRQRTPGVMIIAAGTTDLPVAEEAALTLDLMGHAPLRVNDVGVAGLHRLLAHLPEMRQANVIIVIAGMEGALPSVVGGLVSAPVIAVPTSVGYGASFGGLAALLGMLNSCSAGIAVMNIDNGFGAAHLAARINARIHGTLVPSPSTLEERA